MNYSDVVLNERIWVQLEPTSDDGLASFGVYNGAWDGVIDFKRKVYWAKYYPDTLIPLESIRPAVRAECSPYY